VEYFCNRAAVVITVAKLSRSAVSEITVIEELLDVKIAIELN